MNKPHFKELDKFLCFIPDSEELLVNISDSSNLSIETQFFNNLITKFGDKLQLSKENYVSLEERIINFIKKNPVSDFTPIEVLGPYNGILNTNFGSAIIALISLNLSRALFIEEYKIKTIRWNKQTKEIFDNYLNENPRNPYFLLIIGLQFYNIGFLDKKWLFTNLDVLLHDINDLEFEFFFGSYLFQHDSIALISLEEFKNRELFKKYLILDKKYQQNQCIQGYAWHTILNSFQGDNTLIDYLFEEKKIEYLDSIIMEMWNLKKKTQGIKTSNPYLSQQDNIRQLWTYILRKTKLDSEFFTEIIGKIPLWITLLDEIQIGTIKLLAPCYTDLNKNKYFLQKFFEGLLSTDRTDLAVLNFFFEDFSKNNIIIPQAAPFYPILENLAEKHDREKIMRFYLNFFKIIHFTDSLEFITGIMEKDEPNRIDLISLEMSIINPIRRKYFFSHLDKSGWFQPLIDSKILSLMSPLPYNFWFELYYLMKIKKKFQKVREITKLQNQFNQFIKNILEIRPIPAIFKNETNSVNVFIELLAGASIKQIEKDFKLFLRELQKYKAPSFYRIESPLIQHILPVLIEQKDKDLIYFLLEFLLQFKTHESGKEPYKFSHFKPLFDGYGIGHFLLNQIPKIYAILGKEIFSIILKKIQEIEEKEKNTFSYSLSFYLEKSTQERIIDYKDYKDLLIKFLEQYINLENEQNLNEIIENLLKSYTFQIIVIVLFILLKKREELDLNFELLIFHEQNFLNIYYLLFLNSLFLKEYANKFNATHQLAILNKIKHLKFEESINKNYYGSFLLKKKKQLLIPLQKIESVIPEINDYYLELESKDDERVGEIRPSISGKVWVGGPKADDLKLKEFEGKSVVEICQDLDNYPVEDHSWNETSIAKSLEKDIMRNPKKFLNESAILLKFRGDYMNFIISGFSEVMKQGSMQENEEIIDLYIDLIKEEKKPEQIKSNSSFILYSLYFSLDPKITQLSQEAIDKLITLLDLIEKKLEFTPFSKQTTNINFINSNFYRYFEMYRKISNFQEDRQENILTIQRQKIGEFLGDEDNEFVQNACTYVSRYLFYFWRNDKKWVSSFWDILFQKYWEVSFPVFIKYGLRGYHPEIYNKFEKIQISDRVVKNISDFESDNNFISNFGRYLMISWYNDEFKLTSENIINKSINSCNFSLISALIQEIYSLWKQAPNKGKPLIDYCWSKIIKVGVEMKQIEKKSILNWLIQWFETISELNSENFKLVQISIKECDSNYSLRNILEFLRKNMENSPEMVGNLILSIPLEKNLYFISEEKGLFSIISYLIKNQYKEIATDIINYYAKNDLLFLWDEFRGQI